MYFISHSASKVTIDVESNPRPIGHNQLLDERVKAEISQAKKALQKDLANKGKYLYM